MAEQRKIPTSKVQRAAKLIKTGGKIGGNYVKHYAKKAFGSKESQDELDQENAKELYDSLSELKGSALKAAQMLSMDQSLLPTAYADQFMRAQHSAPPLSYPLITKTFKKDIGKSPEDIFDSFTKNAIHAASIGQVHQAIIGDKKLAVKIQYPGVAESVISDLRMIKPIAARVLNIRAKDVDEYYREVEGKLLEETDYVHELKQSIEIGDKCRHIDGLAFPTYYPEHSGKKVLTMDWLEGIHLEEYLRTNPSQEDRNAYGQALWDFYDYQTHVLKLVHADPHPGNFLFMGEGQLGILDFGCTKRIPEEIHGALARLFDKNILDDKEEIQQVMYALNVLKDNDTAKEKEFFITLFNQGLNMLGRPVHSGKFDFGDKQYIDEIMKEGQRISKLPEVRGSRVARGTSHAVFINRTYFGLYMLLHKLGAVVVTESKYLKQAA